ncbi:ABC transporter substrate-binding protein [Sphingomonas faeni]|uniref:ABC transporter substrate-binding protein n=1 Tax=Sphingomonas faeni TaxID=185950 RepID=UPI003348188B
MPDWTDDERVASAPPPPKEGLKRWWPLLLAAVLAAGLYPWLGRGTASGDVLHVGSQRGGTKPLMLASGALDGAPYRVEWSELPTVQNLPEAIGAGAVDVGMVGDAPFQFAYQSGSPIKTVAVQSATSRPRDSLAILVPARSRIADAGGLRGKRVATTRGSVGHYLLLGTLDAKDPKPSDVRLISPHRAMPRQRSILA